jgi:hypothetical protein
MTRRDHCHLVGSRAFKLNVQESSLAWTELAYQLMELGEKDIPKYRDLIHAIRTATVRARKTARTAALPVPASGE